MYTIPLVVLLIFRAELGPHSPKIMAHWHHWGVQGSSLFALPPCTSSASPSTPLIAALSNVFIMCSEVFMCLLEGASQGGFLPPPIFSNS